MLEFYIFSAIAGLGVMLNNRRSAEKSMTPSNIGPRLGPRPAINARSQPSGSNVYTSNHAHRVAMQEKEAARRSFEASKNPKLTGVIPRATGPLNPITGRLQHRDFHPSRTSTQPTMVESPLTGLKVPVEKFTHNNMTPFFGSRVSQNMDHDVAELSLDHLQGVNNRYAKPKKEVAPMFEPQKNVEAVGGLKGQVDLMRDRVPVPHIRNNEFPIKQERVGPGILNYGSEAQPDVYYRQRQYIMPKTVDQLRARSNPKATGYEGRVLAGMQGHERGLFPKFYKNRPYTTKKRSIYDNFVTTGAYRKPRRLPDVIEAKPTTRPHTHVHYTGPARLAQGGKQAARSRASHAPFKKTLKAPPVQPSSMTHLGRGAQDDHGRGSILVYANERDVTGTRTHQGNVTSLVKALVAPIQDVMRTARKEYMVDAPENTVGVRPQMPSKPTTYDPDAPAKTTTKETTLHDTHGSGTIRGGAYKGVAYDPDAVARTTIRETTEDALKHGAGSVKGGALKSVVYDPDAIARTTTKETTLSEAPRANVRGNVYKGVAYDPDAIARTTTKETTLGEAPRVNLRGGVHKGVAYDPEAIARTTTKETTLNEAPRANPRRAVQKGVAYDPEAVARTTTKETTLGEAPRVNPRRAVQKGVAYDPEAVARTTTKETTLSEAPRANPRRAVHKGVVYDPDAVAKTTTKETTHADGRPYSMVDAKVRRPAYREPGDRAKTTTKETLEDSFAEQRPRNVKGTKKAGVMKDPDAKARTTTKETTLHSSRGGHVDGLEGKKGGYMAAKYEAPHTQKETLHTDYTGPANTGSVEGGGGGGYKVAKPHAKETQKQYTSQHEHYGAAVRQGAKAPPSHEDVMNAMMNETRELVLQGREPTQTSTKVTAGPESVNMREPRKGLPDDFSERFYRNPGKRVPAPPDVQGELAMSKPNLTRERNVYDTESIADRLDVTMLKPLQDNPFTIPSFSGDGKKSRRLVDEYSSDAGNDSGGEDAGGLEEDGDDEEVRNEQSAAELLRRRLQGRRESTGGASTDAEEDDDETREGFGDEENDEYERRLRETTEDI